MNMSLQSCHYNHVITIMSLQSRHYNHGIIIMSLQLCHYHHVITIMSLRYRILVESCHCELVITNIEVENCGEDLKSCL